MSHKVHVLSIAHHSGAVQMQRAYAQYNEQAILSKRSRGHFMVCNAMRRQQRRMTRAFASLQQATLAVTDPAPHGSSWLEPRTDTSIAH